MRFMKIMTTIWPIYMVTSIMNMSTIMTMSTTMTMHIITSMNTVTTTIIMSIGVWGRFVILFTIVP